MTDIAALRDLQPLAAPVVERGTNLEVEGGFHAPIFSKFCASIKQPFARDITQSIAMPKKTLTQVLADRLNELIPATGMSEAAFARKAGVAGNTISNYRRAADDITDKGKPRSAELGKVERIAVALGVSPLELLTSQTASEPENPIPSHEWPFEDVDFERWRRLSDRQKGQIERAINEALDGIEATSVRRGNGMYE